jgi:hypothetical protein
MDFRVGRGLFERLWTGYIESFLHRNPRVRGFFIEF